MSFQGFTPQGNIHRLYLSIIEDLSENIRDSFLDEGLDESHVHEFAHVWQVKLDSTKALENIATESQRHNVTMPITTMIAPSHSVLANRLEESRINYQHKLAMSNYNSKAEPLDFSCAGYNLGKIKSQNFEQPSAALLQNVRQRLQTVVNVRSHGNANSSNIINRDQFRNNLTSSVLRGTTNMSNLLALRNSANEIMSNQIQPNSQINMTGVGSVIKEEPRFLIQNRNEQKMYNLINSNINEPDNHEILLQRAKNNYNQQAKHYPTLTNVASFSNIRPQQNQQNKNVHGINLNSLLQPQSTTRTQNQHMYIKQLLNNQFKSSNPVISQHTLQQSYHLQKSTNKRKHDDQDNDDDDDVSSSRNTFPQFDGQIDDDIISSPRHIETPLSEDTSDDEDDELDRFASVIAPEFSESNDAFITKEDSEPLNSDDDVSEDDPADLFDTDNIVVCQFDKINRSKARWKFLLKEGIMNIRGKDYVFSKAQGEADW